MTKMDALWAPWRMEYITHAKRQKGCLFCRVVKENKDKENLLLYRSRYAFCMLNKFPYNNGHLLVSPYRHLCEMDKLNRDEVLDLFAVLSKMQALLKKILKPDGFNMGINLGRVAGAGIPHHLHMHVVPRWKEDTNFMPVVFSTKIISQSLEALYDQLHKRI